MKNEFLGILVATTLAVCGANACFADMITIDGVPTWHGVTNDTGSHIENGCAFTPHADMYTLRLSPSAHSLVCGESNPPCQECTECQWGCSSCFTTAAPVRGIERTLL